MRRVEQYLDAALSICAPRHTDRPRPTAYVPWCTGSGSTPRRLSFF